MHSDSHYLTLHDIDIWILLYLKALSHILDVVFSKTFFGGICREKKFSKIQHLRCETGPLFLFASGFEHQSAVITHRASSINHQSTIILI